MPDSVVDSDDSCQLGGSSHVSLRECCIWTETPIRSRVGLSSTRHLRGRERRVFRSVVSVEKVGILRFHCDGGGDLCRQSDDWNQHPSSSARFCRNRIAVFGASDWRREEGVEPTGIDCGPGIESERTSWVKNLRSRDSKRK